MAQQRQQYNLVDKQKAVELADTRGNVRAVTEELGVRPLIRRKKILMACSWGCRLSTSGSGSFFYDQAKILIQEGFEVEMLFAKYIFGVTNPIRLPETKVIEGIVCHFIEARTIIPRVASWNIPLHGQQLVRKMAHLEVSIPDFLICQSMIELSHLGPLLSKKWSCGICFIEHHSAFTSKGRFQEPSTLQLRANHVRKSGLPIYAVSDFLRSELEGFRGLSNVRKLFNPVPLELQNRPFVPVKSDIFRFITIGRFDENKRLDRIAVAFSKFAALDSNVELHIITDLNGKERLMNIAQNYADVKIHLNFEYGEFERERIFEMIEESHALVSWSQFETFGMTVLEALALGRPVIVSDSGGVSDMVNSSNSIRGGNEDDSELIQLFQMMKQQFESMDLLQIRAETLQSFNSKTWTESILSN